SHARGRASAWDQTYRPVKGRHPCTRRSRSEPSGHGEATSKPSDHWPLGRKPVHPVSSTTPGPRNRWRNGRGSLGEIGGDAGIVRIAFGSSLPILTSSSDQKDDWLSNINKFFRVENSRRAGTAHHRCQHLFIYQRWWAVP